MTLPNENILPVAITLPPVTLPDTVKVVGFRDPLSIILPAVTFPRV